MAGVSISRAWDEARAIIARDGKLLVAVALALIVLPQVIAGVVAPPIKGYESESQLFAVIAGLIGLAGQLSLIRLALGPSVSVGEAIAHGFKRFPMLLLATILLGILFLVLLIPVAIIATLMGLPVPVPGEALSPQMNLLVLLVVFLLIALSARFILIAPVASAERVGPFAILKRSWNLTSGNYWRFLGLVILFLILALVLLSVAAILGGILGRLVDPEIAPFSASAFIISLFAGIAQAVFTVTASVVLARVYAQLAGPEVSVPSSRD